MHTKRCDRCDVTVKSSLVHDMPCTKDTCSGTLARELALIEAEPEKFSAHPAEVISTVQSVDAPVREMISAVVIHKGDSVIARRETDDRLVDVLKFIHKREAVLRTLGAMSSADLLQQLARDLLTEFSI